MKSRYRDLRSVPSLEVLVRDVRYSARLLRRSPGFALMAFLTLAIGIGATTAVFSLVNRALISPLPVERPGELLSVTNASSRGMLPMFSYPNYADLRDRSGVFSSLVGYRFAPISVSTNGVNERLWGYMVSGNYFQALGVRPAAGRMLSPADDRAPNAHPVAVVSYRFWQQRFGSDPAAIGRSVLVNGRSYTVVGVAAQGFFGTEVVAAPDLWFPLAMQPALENGRSLLDDRRAEMVLVIGRPAQGVPRAQVAAVLERVSADLAREFPDINKGIRIVLVPPGLVGGMMRGPIIGFLGLLLGIAGLVLLLACVNLANLLLARAIDRRREVAVRLSIGAGRAALVRQLLVESLMLSITAGTAGLVLAWWLMRLASTIRLPVDIPFVLDLPLDTRVLVFNLALSLLTAVFFGLVPALQATKADLATVLKDSAASGTRQSAAWRNGLIIVQVAISLVLLTGAGLMWRALGHTSTMILGFDPKGAVEVSFDLRLQGYTPEQGREMQLRLLDNLRAIPGLTSAALTDMAPIDLHYSRARVYAEGMTVERDTRAPSAYLSRVTPGYFEMMRTRLEGGRDFSDQDDADTRAVAIVSRSLARRLWPGQEAIGRRLRVGRADAPLLEIVGIVSDSKHSSFNDDKASAVYRPLRQSYSGTTSALARTTGSTATAIASLRGAVRDLDPNMPIAWAHTFDERLAIPLLPARITAMALASFGVLALVLAAIGLYGVMSYSVSSRTHEIGVRMALGAQRRDVVRMVLGEGGRLVAFGLAIGLAGAALVTRLMTALLFGVSPTDPATYAAVVLTLSGVALIACWIPTKRAVRTDPLNALRT
jgi:predicted permease